MAVKAKAEITLSRIVDIKSVTRYYLLQSSTASAPSKPTANPPGGNWVKAEPSYTSGSTNTLYFVDLTVMTNDTFSYSEVSKSSSYEAAKAAWNKAQNAQDSIDDLEIGGRNLLIGTGNSVIHTGTGSTNQSTQLYKMSDYYNSISSLAGKQLTLSFEWETTATSGKFIVLTNDTPWSDMSGWIVPSSSNKSGKSIYTFVCDSGFDTGAYTGIKVRSDNLTGTVTIKNAMLEFSNKASSWQPAPEDVQFGGRNYILNSVFERPMLDAYDSGASGWACPIGVANASIDRTITHNGHNTLHKQCTYTDDDTWYESNYYFAGDNCIQFNPNEIWSLSLWIYANTIPIDPLLTSIRLFNKNWTWANKVVEIPIGNVVVTEAKKWTHVEITFNTPSTVPTYDRGYIMFTNNQTTDCYMTEFNLEKGNATDWTPAPEDMLSKDEAQDIYTTQLELSKSSSEIRLDFNKSIASATGDIQSKLDDANNTTNQKFSEINKYIRFVDGKIVLGETGNELTLTIQNDRVSFTQNGVEVAYFSNNNLYIKRAEVLTTLKVGNYELTPRNDGGLALRKRGI